MNNRGGRLGGRFVPFTRWSPPLGAFGLALSFPLALTIRSHTLLLLTSPLLLPLSLSSFLLHLLPCCCILRLEKPLERAAAGGSGRRDPTCWRVNQILARRCLSKHPTHKQPAPCKGRSNVSRTALGRVKLSPRRHSTRHFRPPEAVHVLLGEGVEMPFELQLLDQGPFAVVSTSIQRTNNLLHARDGQMFLVRLLEGSSCFLVGTPHASFVLRKRCM